MRRMEKAVSAPIHLVVEHTVCMARRERGPIGWPSPQWSQRGGESVAHVAQEEYSRCMTPRHQGIPGSTKTP